MGFTSEQARELGKRTKRGQATSTKMVNKLRDSFFSKFDIDQWFEDYHSLSAKDRATIGAKFLGSILPRASEIKLEGSSMMDALKEFNNLPHKEKLHIVSKLKQAS